MYIERSYTIYDQQNGYRTIDINLVRQPFYFSPSYFYKITLALV